MELFTIKDLTFSYASGVKALDCVDVTVEEGELLLLLGASGSGKTTFLKQLKPELRPTGTQTGEIQYCSRRLKDVPLDVTTTEIGYLFQNPEHQVVTDQVWHELAFGLESMGMSKAEMDLKIAETASFLGISEWFHKSVEALSGGQLQLLNLASILTMNPKVVLLDEPLSQLDPVASENFLHVLMRMKQELGITIIISEHRVERLFSLADKVMVLDKGRVIREDTPAAVAKYAFANDILELLPVIPRVCLQMDTKIQQPAVTMAQGRAWLCDYIKQNDIQYQVTNEIENKNVIEIENKKIKETKNKKTNETENVMGTPNIVQYTREEKELPVVLAAKKIFFRYERKSRDILKDINFTVKKGECFGLLGGNGTGKTTLLSILYGYLKPYAGHVKQVGKVVYVSQNPQVMFSKDTVAFELEQREKIQQLFAEMWTKKDTNKDRENFLLQTLYDRHPYDLSGGEQQRLAFLIALQQQPDILLLDEPTKGMDDDNKDCLGRMLKHLQTKGVTIVMVSHDVEFVAKYTNRCGLLFDGRLTGVLPTHEFMLLNRYYTTTIRRMTWGQLEDMVTEEELVSCWTRESNT